jgi:hypothetical protein
MGDTIMAVNLEEELKYEQKQRRTLASLAHDYMLERDTARAAANESANQLGRLLQKIRSYADDYTICPFCSVHGDRAHLRTCLVYEAESVLKKLKRF